ncbi:MAG: hypothetical protein FWC55_03885, partial [Firmicutes bacterium]|nr:hypothetical protein [Bacillota bacterium]
MSGDKQDRKKPEKVKVQPAPPAGGFQGGPGGGRRRGGPMGGGMRMMPGEKAKDFKGAMLKLVKYLGAYKWAIMFVWALAIVSQVLMIIGPKILGHATDEIVSGM